jgi:RimJ/RimL family protein N-acetyltransferase
MNVPTDDPRAGTLPVGYPQHLCRSFTTRSGVSVLIRPIRPDDAERLVEFHRGLSFETVYYRYFRPHRVLDDVEVERFTHVDYHNRLAFVAERDGVLVGVGRYERLPETSGAEVAFVIADEHQGQGIGHVLFEQLVLGARENGISEFVAETMGTNIKMLKVFAHSGHPYHQHVEDGVVSITLDIGPRPPTGDTTALPS